MATESNGSFGLKATQAEFTASSSIQTGGDSPENASKTRKIPARRGSADPLVQDALEIVEHSVEKNCDDAVNTPSTSSSSQDKSQDSKTPTPPKVKVQIGPQHFDLLKLVGEGAFGKVILVRNRLNSELYAMKVITKKLLKRKNHYAYMKSERDILTRVQHPFIVTLAFAFQTEQRLFLVMDFLGGGELFYHLRRRGLIMEKEARADKNK